VVLLFISKGFRIVGMAANITQLPVSQVVQAERARKSFALFAKEAWHVIEPGRPYVGGWHLDAIAEHLEAVTHGYIKKLLVNMPPRHGKSTYIDVLWSVWLLLNKPSTRLLCGSYALNLATRDNIKARRLIRSNWFQARYGNVFTLTHDQNAKMKFETDQLGYRMVTSVGSGTTGEGGDILLCLCYNTEVTTDRGRLSIGDVVERQLPVQVLAYDHKMNTERWQVIEKYEKNPGRACVRVTLNDGRFVDATADHPFYVVGRGYIPAAQLTSMDRVITDENFLSDLRKRNRSSSSSPCPRQEGHILQPCMSRKMANWRKQSCISGRQSRTALQVLRKGIFSQTGRIDARKRQLLQPFMQLQSEYRQSTSQSLCGLCILRQTSEGTISQAVGERDLLHAQLCQHSAQQKDEGHRQSEVRTRNGVGTLSTRISDISAVGTSTRQSAVSTLPDDSRTERQGIRRSSYRLRQRTQRTAQFDNPLPVVSWENAWFSRQSQEVATTIVNSVESIETPEYVYNIRVAEDHNYYANGVLVHNCDDPHNIDEKESPAKREAALDWFDNTWSSRLNDQQTGAMVVVAHRIHEQDVSGHILETNDGEWIHLNLPAEYETETPCVTQWNGGGWSDPRTREGELLWTERFPQEVIDKAKRRHGVYGYSALYGQKPVPAGGGIFKQKHERLFSVTHDSYILHTPRGDRSVLKDDCELYLTIDPAISENESADYMVIGTWAKTPIKDMLLLAVRRDRWSYKDQQDEVEDAFNEDCADFAAVETVAYQHALFQDLLARGIPCRPFKPQKDKVSRAANAAIWQENGKLYFLYGASWLEELRKELYKFPKTSHDDQIDMISLSSIVVRSQGPLSDDSLGEDDIPDAIDGPVPALSDGDTEPILEAITVPLKSNKQIDPFAWSEMHGGWGYE